MITPKLSPRPRTSLLQKLSLSSDPLKRVKIAFKIYVVMLFLYLFLETSFVGADIGCDSFSNPYTAINS